MRIGGRLERTARTWAAPLLIALALAAAGCARHGAGTCDSLVLITIDTLRADHVSCYGHSPVPTPNIDAVAGRGARVERAWTSTPLTTPAHASILTGLYPPSHGVRNNARFCLPDDVTTLAEILAARGLRTAAFVGSFTTSRLFGLGQGFETFDDDMGNDSGGRRRAERPGDEVAARAVAWLEGHASKPFFLWVHLYDPHTPYVPPPDFAARYPSDPYSGEVAFADVQVGRVLKALQDMGASPRTVVVAMSDHGEGLDTHGEAEHGFLLYEETLRVPFVIEAPGKVAPGTTIRGVASVVDLVPTVLGLLSVPQPGGLQGEDLLAAPDPKKPPRTVYAETLYPHEEFGWSALYACRREDLKVIEAPQRELYDLSADPAERHDLSSSRAGETREMIDDLHETAGRLVDPARLAAAIGLGAESGMDPETVTRLESLGYVGGGGGVNQGVAEGLPAVGGRNPREAMGDLKLFEQAQNRMRAGFPDEAIGIFESLLKSDPANPQVLLKLAQALQRSGRAGEAEVRFGDLIRAHPTFYLGYRSYSDFLERQGRPRESRDLWMRLSGLMPGYVGIDVRLAQAEIASGLPADAVRHLARYLEKRPQDAAAWSQLGRARSSMNDPAGAIEAYRKALEVHPTETAAIEGITALMVSTGRESEALELLGQLLAVAPGDPALLKARADLQR